jgi:methylglutaconyl-CoA hydratase
MLRLERSYGPDVLVLVLDRPAARNALDGALVRRLHDALRDAEREPGLRAVVLRGAAGVFCAGADLGWMRTMAEADEATNLRDATELAALLDALATLPVPTLAVAESAAYGGGLGLLAACDVALADEDCRFAFSEVRLGLVPAVIAPYVVRACGRPRALAPWIYSGAVFDAREAHRVGLVHALHPRAALDGALVAFLDALRAAAPGAVRAAKSLLASCEMHPGGRAAIDHAEATASLIARLRAAPEGREGIRAFLEKRTPHWPETSP